MRGVSQQDRRLLALSVLSLLVAALCLPVMAADSPPRASAQASDRESSSASGAWYDRVDLRPLGVVAYWPLDWDSLDHSGSGNNGVWQPGGYHTPGVRSNGYQIFPGVYYTVTDSPTLQSTFQEITLAAWFKAEAVPYDNEALLGIGADDGLDPRFYLFVGPGSGVPVLFALAVNDQGERVDSAEAVPIGDFLGGWHHLAVSFDGEATRVYVDGKLQSERHGLQGTFTMKAPFYMNRHDWWTWDSRLTGVIDEAVVLKRAISPREVRLLMRDADGDGVADFWQELISDVGLSTAPF